MSLAKLYPQDFDSGDLRDLDKDLCLYIADVRTDASFSNIATITELSKKWCKQGDILCILCFIGC